MNAYLGIDPGLSGALALYDPETRELTIYDVPTHKITKNGSAKRTVDLYQLGTLIDMLKPKIKTAVIEDVSAMPKQGVTSSFNFGFTTGVLQAMIASNMIPMHLVRPATWKKVMQVSADKDSSRRRASQLLPKHSGQWPLKGHDGRAEATLLAIYGAEYL